MTDAARPMTARELLAHCHQVAVDRGWWLGKDNVPVHEQIAIKIALIGTEIREAEKGFATGAMDDHLPHRKMFEVELADALIRVADLAGFLELPLLAIDGDPRALLHISSITLPINLMLLDSFCAVSDAFEAHRRSQELLVPLQRVMATILAITSTRNIDLVSIVIEKCAYNQLRPDHSPEARAAEGGKTF